MVAAQVLSILALCVSWFWWVTFTFGLVAMTMLQVIWCCRMKRSGLVVAAVVAGTAAACSLLSGIYAILAWQGDSYCHVFVLTGGDGDDDDFGSYGGGDYCSEVGWAVVAFITGAMWGAASVCIGSFLASGRYARWEEAAETTGTRSADVATPHAVEMMSVTAPVTGAGATMDVLPAAATASAYHHGDDGGEGPLPPAIPASSYVVTESADEEHFGGGYAMKEDFA